MQDLSPPDEAAGLRTFKTIYEDGTDQGLIDGVPLVEMGLEIQIGPCCYCGESQAEKPAGAMLNARSLPSGVIVGDSVCVTCLLERDATGDEALTSARAGMRSGEDNA